MKFNLLRGKCVNALISALLSTTMVFSLAPLNGAIVNAAEEEMDTTNVYFDMHGHGTAPDPLLDVYGIVKGPAKPTAEGYYFAGWYYDENFTLLYEFDYADPNYYLGGDDITLHAKWIDVADCATIYLDVPDSAYLIDDSVHNNYINITDGMLIPAGNYTFRTTELSKSFRSFTVNGSDDLERDSLGRIVLKGGDVVSISNKFETVSNTVTITVDDEDLEEVENAFGYMVYPDSNSEYGYTYYYSLPTESIVVEAGYGIDLIFDENIENISVKANGKTIKSDGYNSFGIVPFEDTEIKISIVKESEIEPEPTPVVTPEPTPVVTPESTPVVTPAPTTPSPVPSSKELVSNFTERLYETCMNRPSDASGKEYWENQLNSGVTGADVAKMFIYSDEFNQAALSDEEFVTSLYEVFMGREPDNGGFEYWVNQLESGTSRDSIVDGFVNSNEWANVCFLAGIESGGSGEVTVVKEPTAENISFTNRLYETCLGRDADQEGLDFWAGELANKKMTGTEVAYGFFFSEQFINKNLSDKDFVNTLYSTILGRAADPDGFDFWMNQLANSDRQTVFYQFAGCSEFGRICDAAGIAR